MSMIVTLTGPSCGGKSTMEQKLVETGLFGKIISHTTRPMRTGEVNGEAYYFLPKEDFAVMRAGKQLLEDVHFNGNDYGASCAEVERVFATGKAVVLVCEPIGAAQIRKHCQTTGVPCFQVFVDAPAELLAERFLARFAKEPHMLTTYAKRLGGMMTLERDWSLEGQRADSPYDLYVAAFNPDTEQAVLAQVQEKLQVTEAA